MKWGGRFAARLGLDGNSLRRRSDKIAAYGKAGLLAVFLIGAPVACVATGMWSYHSVMAQEQAQRSWHQVTAVVLDSVPQQDISFGAAWAPASWTAAGQGRKGRIPVHAATAAGAHIPIWVDASGQLTGQPLSRDTALAEVATEVAVTPFALAIVLAVIAAAARYLLDRGRMGRWGAEWASVGPEWTKQFRSTGK